MLALIEYGMGNIGSVKNAFELLGEEICVTNNPTEITKAEAIILPGVGAFSDGMKNLKQAGLLDVLEEEVIQKKKPYLGICLGLEFLANKSFEGGIHEGFGWIDGEIKKIQPTNETLKVPHMGWNDTEMIKKGGLLHELENPVFYYLHSYFFQVNKSSKNTITSICKYGDVTITASVQKDNIYAVQFHPEKSQTTGIKLLKNFLEDIRK